MKNPALSIVIPAYNESERIGITLDSIVRYFSRIDAEFEVIVVDDGSTDGTSQIVESWGPQIKNLKVILNEENLGKGFSVKRGMLAAKGDYRLFMDADNSVDISHLNVFSPWLEKGFDLVIGSIHVREAMVREESGWHKRLLGKLSRYLIHLVAGLQVKDTQRGFKLFSAHAANTIFPLQTISPFGFDIELLVIAQVNGLRVKEVPVKWINPTGSKVRLSSYGQTLLELLKITRNRFLGIYLKKQRM